MRYLIVAYINAVEVGVIIDVRDLYKRVYEKFPNECDRLGFTPSQPIEEKWKKDIRWGLQDAKHQGLVVHVGPPKSRKWKRI